MTFVAEETSLYRGAPVELFHFQSDDALENWARTTGDVEIIDGLLVYEVAPIKRGSLRSSAGEPQGQMQVEMPIDDPLVRKFIAYLPERQILLTVYRMHEGDSLAEKVPVFIGTVSSVNFTEEKATLSCQPVTGAQSRMIPWQSYKALCNWALYGQGCGVLRAAHQTALPSGPNFAGPDTLVDPAFSAFPDGWYRNGYVEVLTTREVRYIVSHVGDTITLIAPFTTSPAGNSTLVYPGCDRSEATCRNKFDNIANYLGFNRVPTSNPFDTSFSGSGGRDAPSTITFRGIPINISGG